MKRRKNVKANFIYLIIAILCAFLLGFNLGRGANKKTEQLIRPEAEVQEITPTPTPSEGDKVKVVGETMFGNSWFLFQKIIYCESGGNPEAYSKGNSGLLQINQVHNIPRYWLEDPFINLAVGRALFEKQGLSPWKYSQTCWEER